MELEVPVCVPEAVPETGLVPYALAEPLPLLVAVAVGLVVPYALAEPLPLLVAVAVGLVVPYDVAESVTAVSDAALVSAPVGLTEPVVVPVGVLPPYDLFRLVVR